MLFEHQGTMVDLNQGKYQRSGILWFNECFNKKETKFIRENAKVIGIFNLTVMGQ